MILYNKILRMFINPNKIWLKLGQYFYEMDHAIISFSNLFLSLFHSLTEDANECNKSDEDNRKLTEKIGQNSTWKINNWGMYALVSFCHNVNSPKNKNVEK